MMGSPYLYWVLTILCLLCYCNNRAEACGFVNELTEVRNEFKLDHVHQVEVDDIENFQGLVLWTHGGQSLFIAGQGAPCYLSDMCPEGFHELQAILHLLPELEEPVNAHGEYIVIPERHTHCNIIRIRSRTLP